MRKIGTWLLAMFVAAAFACSKSPEPPAEKVVKAVDEAQELGAGEEKQEVAVGAILPLSGAYADYGKRVKDGLEAALDHLGRAESDLAVTLNVLDNAGSPEKTKEAFAKLSAQGVLAVIGAVEPLCTSALAKAAASSGVAVISPVCPAQGLESLNHNLVRLAAPENLQARALARYATKELNIRIAAVYHELDPQCLSFVKLLEEQLKSEGSKVILKRVYDPTAGNYKTDLKAAKHMDIEGLFVVGLSPETHNVLRQARQVGITKPILGGVLWDRPGFPADIDNLYYAAQFSAASKGPLAGKLTDILTARKSGPDTYSALAFDAMLLVVHSARTSEQKDAKSVAASLLQAKNIPGATGYVSAVATEKDIFIIAVRNGEKRVAAPKETETP